MTQLDQQYQQPLVTARYTKALQSAAELHMQQRRKGKPVPYISHLIAVSALVWEDGARKIWPSPPCSTIPSRTAA